MFEFFSTMMWNAQQWSELTFGVEKNRCSWGGNLISIWRKARREGVGELAVAERQVQVKPLTFGEF